MWTQKYRCIIFFWYFIVLFAWGKCIQNIFHQVKWMEHVFSIKFNVFFYTLKFRWYNIRSKYPTSRTHSWLSDAAVYAGNLNSVFSSTFQKINGLNSCFRSILSTPSISRICPLLLKIFSQFGWTFIVHPRCKYGTLHNTQILHMPIQTKTLLFRTKFFCYSFSMLVLSFRPIKIVFY